MDEAAAAPQAAGGTQRPRGGRHRERWQAIKAAYPGAELDRETSAAQVDTVRGRLSPDDDWTPRSLNMNKVLCALEDVAAQRPAAGTGTAPS